MGNDIFMGGIKFLPDFDNMGTQDQWYDLTGSPGKIQIGVAFKPSSVSAFVAPKSHAFTHAEVQGHSLTIDDFELTTVIGKGSFGKVRSIDLTYPLGILSFSQVLQVRKRDTSRIYALKTIRKAHIVNRNEITHTLAERLVLARVNSPFIVPLKFSFQSEQKLYLVLAYVMLLFLFPFSA
jgi:serum/glucocorticoid-regulated kinase 2